MCRVFPTVYTYLVFFFTFIWQQLKCHWSRWKRMYVPQDWFPPFMHASMIWCHCCVRQYWFLAKLYDAHRNLPFSYSLASYFADQVSYTFWVSFRTITLTFNVTNFVFVVNFYSISFCYKYGGVLCESIAFLSGMVLYTHIGILSFNKVSLYPLSFLFMLYMYLSHNNGLPLVYMRWWQKRIHTKRKKFWIVLVKDLASNLTWQGLLLAPLQAPWLHFGKFLIGRTCLLS